MSGCRRITVRDFHLTWQIPFPALLDFAGFPRHRNQQWFNHKGTTGTSLSFFIKRNGNWTFHCNNPECGITGDQTEFWFQLVEKARLQPAGWCLPQACADLLARVESGEIDISISEFEGESAKANAHGHARRSHGEPFSAGDGYWEKLGHLIQKNKGREIEGRMRLPTPIGISLEDVILGLFPENRLIMLANQKRREQLIGLRDEWLMIPALKTCSHVSQNYCCRCDVDGTSYDALEGIERRWIVIEADQGTLEQQFWLHKQLEADLGCLCYSGGKSLHGWYYVDGWSLEQCFDLYAKAISLGVNDRRTWLICTQARLPGGVLGRQHVLAWNL